MSAGTLRRLHRAGGEPFRVWFDWRSGYGVDPTGAGFAGPPRAPVGDVCDMAVRHGATLVELCGVRPGGGDVTAFAEWREPGTDWEVAAKGHYLRDLLAPVLRYRRDRLEVEIRSAGEWFGDHAPVGPRDAYNAAEVARGVLTPRFYGARLWSSPMATGTDLILRALPEGVEYRPLPVPMQRQIQQSTTQGRIETRALEGPLPAVVEYDGRFAYSALCAELPVGEPVTGPGGPDPDALGYLPGTNPMMVRGRFEIEFRAPPGWAHVGLIPHLSDKGWTWPADRRWRKTWCNGAEVELATRPRWGWEVKIRRHIAWTRPANADPLRRWAELLVAAREQAELLTRGESCREGAAALLRSILLTTIGVLHGKGHPITRTAPYVANFTPPPNAERLHVQAGRYVWTEMQPPARPEYAHPEWTDAIWSRCRARLLDGPPVAGVRTGALHVDPSTVLAFSGDALYLTADPDWPDDRRTGRLRRKALHPGPLPAPSTRAELLELLRAERGTDALTTA